MISCWIIGLATWFVTGQVIVWRVLRRVEPALSWNRDWPYLLLYPLLCLSWPAGAVMLLLDWLQGEET